MVVITPPDWTPPARDRRIRTMPSYGDLAAGSGSVFHLYDVFGRLWAKTTFQERQIALPRPRPGDLASSHTIFKLAPG